MAAGRRRQKGSDGSPLRGTGRQTIHAQDDASTIRCSRGCGPTWRGTRSGTNSWCSWTEGPRRLLPAARTYAGTHAHAHTYTHTHAHTRTYANAHTHTHTHTHAHTHATHTHTHTHTRHTHTHTHTHTQTHTRTHTRTHTHTHTCRSVGARLRLRVPACVLPR